MPTGAPPEAVDAFLDTLERLLAMPAADLKLALTQVADLAAAQTQADKVDAFLFDDSRKSLVAVGASNQPLSALERQLGLDVLPVANGGTSVQVFETGELLTTGRLDLVDEELRGFKDALAVRSLIAVPFEIGPRRRGVLVVSSQKPEFFTAEDARYVQTLSRWVGVVAHRAELVETITKNAIEQGRQAAADELVTVLAHDLRNFLDPISMRMQLIALRAEEDQRADDVRDAQVALRVVGRLTDLVSDVLDVARIDHGMFTIDPMRVDLAPLIRETVDALSSEGHRVVVHVAEDVTVVADARRLRQCIENLVSNAIKHSPDAAPVTIELSRGRSGRGPCARIEVIDEGTGVPGAILPKLFERFVTGGGPKRGLGLGLYIAKRVAEAHGGDLHVESPPGRGARFILTLPSLRER